MSFFSEKNGYLSSVVFFGIFMNILIFCLRKDVIISTKSVSSFFRSSVFFKTKLG